MRRLAAVFSVKRSDKSDAGSNASTADHGSAPSSSKTKHSMVKGRSGLFRSFTKGSSKSHDTKSRKHPMPPVSTFPPPDQATSSASSSSGGPTTPSDDHESVGHHNHAKKSWSQPFMVAEKFVAPGVLSPPPPPVPSQHGPYVPRRYADDASSTSSKSESADEGPLPPPKPSNTSPPLSPVAYFRVITTNASAEPFSPPPLLLIPNSPLYPRSSNLSRQLAPSESLRVRMHRKHLLARLDVADPRALADFSQRHGVPARSKRLSLVLDDVALKRGHQVGSFSQGLRRWAERPCFEDRMIIYLPTQDTESGLRCERVSSSNAVEALGYSEELELLAALDEHQVQDPVFTALSPNTFTPDLSSTPSSTSLSSGPSSPLMTDSTTSLNGANTKAFPSASYKAAPSPLRIASTDSAPQFPSALPPVLTSRSVSTPSLQVPASLRPGMSPSRTSPAISPNSTPATKPAVHFAQDDKDESIPLDYVMRIKQARDQKAKFLAAERARRSEEQARGEAAKRAQEDKRQLIEERKRLEEARRKHEEERRKQEVERKRLEQERAVFERDRRAAEEEKKNRIIMDELVEARRRRESHRSGPIPKGNEGVVAWEGDREKERERRRQESRGSYSRPKYDDTALPRQSSEISLSSSPIQRPSVPFANSSPGSSRPASMAGSQRGSSRPPSMYSTPPSSASDIRTRRESKTSRRTSFVSDGAYPQPQQMMFQSGTPPSAMNPWMIPPVPPLPNFMPVAVPVTMMPMAMGPMGAMPYDMPLLPPAAPFMMQQFGQRGHGQRSHSASPTRGHGSGSGSDRGSAHGRDSPSNSHKRRPSGEAAIVASGGARSSHPPAQSPSYATVRSSRSGNPAYAQQQQGHSPSPSFQRPVPVSTTSYARQPGFENLSRPSSSRRQTMIT